MYAKKSQNAIDYCKYLSTLKDGQKPMCFVTFTNRNVPKKSKGTKVGERKYDEQREQHKKETREDVSYGKFY
jgi:hypothetical protein